MFHKIHHKLAGICCCITSCIVLAIILVCLSLSEKNMENEDRAFFLLKTKPISFELMSSQSIDKSWYSLNSQYGHDLLYIEVNGVPSTFSTLLLTDTEKALIEEMKAGMPETDMEKINDTSLEYLYDVDLVQNTFEYRNSAHSYRVMSSQIQKNNTLIHYWYLHSLDDFKQQILRQRISYLVIWLVSTALLYIFSFYFTAHALKPLIENQNKQKQFIALASHELRSPLAVFKTGLSILKTCPEPSKAARFYDMLGTEIKRMEHLISDLLFLSKAEQTSLNYQFQPVNLSALLDGVYEKYLPIAADKKIRLLLDSKTPENLWCNCDSQRIEQVIIILLDNALTYTPSEGTVTLGITASRSRNQIYVRDTGCGIRDEDKNKIFDKFYQANAAHNSKEHFGLGLSIAKEISRAHKGTLTVTDTKGGGSTFTLSLKA